MSDMKAGCDATIVDIGWPYHGLINRRREYLETPDWINMSVSLPREWPTVISGFRQSTRNNDLRLIRRNEYRPDFTTTQESIEEFYDTMYLPFVTHKHAEDSIIATRRQVIKRATQGTLLRVTRAGEVVAAGVIYLEQNVLYFLWMGIPPSYLDAPPEGAISALYFFGIQYAFERGCSAVDFTGTRAFLEDGAFRFKRKWGGIIEDTFSPSSILIAPARLSNQAVRLFENLPILVRGSEGLEAVVVSQDETLEGVTLSRLRKEYACLGMARLTILKVSGKNETISLPADVAGCECRVVDVSLDRFAERYVNS
jgi:hypothetical protein